jgi:hypothetical protein
VTSARTYVDEPTGTSISEEAANIMGDPEDQAPEATDSSSSSYRDLASTKSINKETLFSIGSSGTYTSLI